MQDIIEQVEVWQQKNEALAIATVVKTWGSSPRPVGSKLACTADGRMAGSVSAGCVEGDVISQGMEVIAEGQPRLLHYGVTDEDSWVVGLACGGNIDVLVEPFASYQPVYQAMRSRLERRLPFALITLLPGLEGNAGRKVLVDGDGRVSDDLSLGDNHEKVVTAALDFLAAGKGGMAPVGDDVTYFVDVFPPSPRLIIVGAVHIGIHLVAMANEVGFDTYVVDPRGGFATPDRFAHATALIKDWPQRALTRIGLDPFSYVVVLTHDPKLDDPALKAALPSEVCYVGALGSRRTNASRRQRLLAAGLAEDQLNRLHAPIGLDLGGRSPGEIAVSIMAEIVRARHH